MLELKAITHSYGTHRVVEGFSLTLMPGQRVALMGPSGCGKTTLLRIALGLMNPTEGTVKNSFSNPVAVFQEPRLLPWRTALENVNLVLGDGKSTLAQAEKALERMRLSEAKGKYPRELSGGMQQRAAIARALAASGDLLVLDEPFKGLDDALHDHVLAEVSQTRAAILLVTHDRSEAESLGCTIIEL